MQLIEKDEAEKRKLQTTAVDNGKPLGGATQVAGNTIEKSLETISAAGSENRQDETQTVEGTSKKGDEKDRQETGTGKLEKSKENKKKFSRGLNSSTW